MHSELLSRKLGQCYIGMSNTSVKALSQVSYLPMLSHGIYIINDAKQKYIYCLHVKYQIERQSLGNSKKTVK